RVLWMIERHEPKVDRILRAARCQRARIRRHADVAVIRDVRGDFLRRTALRRNEPELRRLLAVGRAEDHPAAVRKPGDRSDERPRWSFNALERVRRNIELRDCRQLLYVILGSGDDRQMTA